MSLFAEALEAWAGVISLSRREVAFRAAVFTQQMYASARDESDKIKGAGIRGDEAICEGKHA